MLTLNQLVGAVAGVLDRGGPRDIEIRGIHYDSRRIEPGFLFVAVPGLRTDGHLYVQEAVRRGAVAVVVQKDLPLPPEVAWLKVQDSRRALADLAACYYGYPSRRLRMFGVTGTNGKTTTAYLIHEILRQTGCPTGLVGTVSNRLGDRVWPAEHTTPESLDLQALLAEMLAAGARAVAMEVSSHALALERVRGTEFDVAVFTNLTQDHLDFHPDMESYFASKAKLFRELGPGCKGGPKYAVINADDPWAERLLCVTGVPVVGYGFGPRAVVRGEGLQMDRSGSKVVVVGPGFRLPVRLRLLGQFNVYNALAAWAVAWQEGLDLQQVAEILGWLTGAPGRFERVERGQEFAVIVDYAHTPDGLENALRAARQLTERRLIVVFGCGGDRDRKKRPLMGEAAARWSDYCIITSDNPRSEEPEDIIAEIEPGVRKVRALGYEIEVDRRRAIARALEMARPGDTVVIAGKGHENYQLVKGQVLPFDDRVVAAEELERLGYRETVEENR
ncbi:MAG TPA: UDP-N-acetylmuramoyl-L-alanyl-D-glutamate--2,6-diaminopimelate ligase [Peptococcaceae bacterium]|nr:MAG: UDP-N-acetylmuramoyl-L-alanyl-D-glutamate--2,6-diaminopimelate ligase [Moorella sp. 60_41]HBT48137.1 UDP-N-acetylmuramoyl-L-alanyl-D-glutamate--2,6-diaminopimelate ligase [Peptococcaceae bacterium]